MTTFLPYSDFDKCAEVMHLDDINTSLKTVYDILSYHSVPHVGLWRNGSFFARPHLMQYAAALNNSWMYKMGLTKTLFKGVIRNPVVPARSNNSWFHRAMGVAPKPMPGRNILPVKTKIRWVEDVHQSHQTMLFLNRKNYYNTHFDNVNVFKQPIFGGMKIE